MKVRIFALAKELGIENKQLFELAADAGLEVKNSPLASVTAEEADALRAAAAKGSSAAKSEPAPPRDVAPRREPAPDRSLKDLGRTGPLGLRRRRQAGDESDVEEPEDQDVEETEAEDAQPVEAEAAKAPAEEQPAEAPEEDAESSEPVKAKAPAEPEATDESSEEGEESSEQVEAAKAEAKPAPKVSDDAAAEKPAEEEVASEKAAADAGDEKAAKEEPGDEEVGAEKPAAETPDTAGAEEKKPAAKSPDSPQKPVRPTSRPSMIREMKPVGTVRGSGGRTKKKEQAAPQFALPNIKGPIGGEKKESAPAQKPEVRLTADILKQNSPLSQIRKRAEEARAREQAGGGRGGGARRAPTGTGIEQAREQRRNNRKRGRVGADEDRIIRNTLRRRTRRRPSNFELKSEATVDLPVDIRGLSEAIGRPARDILRVFMNEGEMKTINDFLTEEEALEVALEMGVELHFKQKETVEDRLMRRLEEGIPEGAKTASRPPVVTILGHVDHGKTTLVDKLRGANVAAGEAGGITQHIAAYQVRRENGQKITFVDTPGHAAFGEMRARGANVTDIIVLVVAADDGVMPQTVESISHAKAAGCPIIVAMTKCDLPDRNEQKVLTDLSTNELLPSEYGGEVDVIRVSAMTGDGIEELLETISLTAELQDYKAAVDVPAYGVCLEGFRDEGRGPMAWTIVQQGTLKVGDVMLCGPAFGKVRAMYDDSGKPVKKAGPSTPVKIAGLDEVPGAGDRFFETDNIDDARTVAEEKRIEGRGKKLARRGGGAKTLEQILAGEGPKELPLIIKADTPGSIEAIIAELEKFDHPEVGFRFLHEGVGGVNESDVYLAASTGAIIIAFHVIADDLASSLADKEKVEIKRYQIIYEVTDELRNILEGMLEPEKREVATGRAIVLQTFQISRFGTIAGCRVLSGTIQRNGRVHVIRDQTILNNYGIASLKREKDDTREVREGFECGIRLDGFNDIKEGDLLEAYRIEEVKRTLEGSRQAAEA